MKKKLEADLMSIAHRVLQIKNKSDINQLYIETQKLYEKLSVLRFVEEHFGDAKPTIGQAEIVEKMKHFFEDIHITDPLKNTFRQEIVVEELMDEEVLNNEEAVQDSIEAVREESLIDKEKEMESTKDLGFQPAFEIDVVEEAEKPIKTEEIQISFLDILGSDYSEPMFVKADSSEEISKETKSSSSKVPNFLLDKEEIMTSTNSHTKNSEPKSVSLNDKFAKGKTIGLNDRIAFVKHLFGNSDEDYTRVMNQLITYNTFEEAQIFIEEMVKPDYNSWIGKEDYSQRFLEIIEKKFT